MKTFALIMTLLTMTFATIANADQEWELETHGFWTVSLVEFPDGSMACKMSSEQEEEDGRFYGTHVWTYGPEGGFVFILGDNTYNFEPEDIEFQFWIDGAYWTVNGRLDGPTVMSAPIFDVEFMHRFMAGNTLRWRNENGEWTHEFSLHGSNAATQALMDCGDRVAVSLTPTY